MILFIDCNSWLASSTLVCLLVATIQICQISSGGWQPGLQFPSLQHLASTLSAGVGQVYRTKKSYGQKISLWTPTPGPNILHSAPQSLRFLGWPAIFYSGFSYGHTWFGQTCLTKWSRSSWLSLPFKTPQPCSIIIFVTVTLRVKNEVLWVDVNQDITSYSWGKNSISLKQ